jgi:hypothetical protein
MKEILTLLLCSLNAMVCFAQNEDSTFIDDEIKKNPATFPVEYVVMNKINQHSLPKRFAGMRWVDFGLDTAVIGCVKTINYKFNLIVLKERLGSAFNAAMRYKKAPTGSDSLVIYLLDFWLSENPPSSLGENMKETLRLGTETKLKYSTKDYGYITALVCSKDSAGQMYYHGKLDTMITLAYSVKGWYGAAAADIAERTLEVCLPIAQGQGRQISETALNAEIKNFLQLPDLGTLPDGLFLSFKDFKKGKVLPISLKLSPRVYAYAVEFGSQEHIEMYSQGYWGLCYKGNFYMKRGNTVAALYKVGHTYCMFAGSRPLEAVMVNSKRVFNNLINEFRKGPTTYSPERTHFYPFSLNAITGKIE